MVGSGVLLLADGASLLVLQHGAIPPHFREVRPPRFRV
jgi:hypothetical protein